MKGRKMALVFIKSLPWIFTYIGSFCPSPKLCKLYIIISILCPKKHRTLEGLIHQRKTVKMVLRVQIKIKI